MNSKARGILSLQPGVARILASARILRPGCVLRFARPGNSMNSRICTRSLELDRLSAPAAYESVLRVGQILSPTGPGFREPPAALAAVAKVAAAAAGASLQRVDSCGNTNSLTCEFAIPSDTFRSPCSCRRNLLPKMVPVAWRAN